jgi:membrane protease YdiL (CAAX protease family)
MTTWKDSKNKKENRGRAVDRITNVSKLVFLEPMACDRILSCSLDIHLPVGPMLREAHVIKCFVVFAVAFGLRQAVGFFFNTGPYESGVGSLASFGIALITVLLVKSEGFREHGFHIPRRANRLLAIALFLAVVYVLVVIFVPGGSSGFEALPGAAISWDLLFTAGSVLLAVVAAEAVFRGYIQTNLENAYGFSVALIVVSAAFTLYMLPVTLYTTVSSTELFRRSLPLVAESVFLCFFFKDTKTLLCPIAFVTAATLLQTFTPLEPTATEYATLVSLISYAFLVPIMEAFIDDVKQQEARAEAVPDAEPE